MITNKPYIPPISVKDRREIFDRAPALIKWGREKGLLSTKKMTAAELAFVKAKLHQES